MTQTKPTGYVAWIVPPECQGQHVECAYGTDEEGGRWERVTDRSGPEVTHHYLGHATDEGEWEPHNRQPEAARS